MPPRKRRPSAQSEEAARENLERYQTSAGVTIEAVKSKSVVQRGTESCPTERRLTARQQSRQEAQLARQESQQNPGTDDRLQDSSMPSTSADTGAKQPTRFSTRVVKRPRRDLSPPESPVKKDQKLRSSFCPIKHDLDPSHDGDKESADIVGKKVAATTPTTTPETKGKRTWELWSVEDKDSFFEGLCEYGKDFESIHNLIVSKCRKKGNVMPITVKNKEQVRHFYYRTWHKISKLIEPVEDLKKDIQELYGLISYSVLRKKLRGGVNPNDKNWQKLNELVHQGAATIKVKGKRIRVKTPVCAALKKLNNYEDIRSRVWYKTMHVNPLANIVHPDQIVFRSCLIRIYYVCLENPLEPRRAPGPKLPEKIRVEFRPKTNTAWKQVQDLSQNPRLRICVKPERNLQSLIKFLDKKWTPQRLKSKMSLNEAEVARHEFRVYPHRDSVMKNVFMEAVDDPVVHFCLKDHNKDSLNISPSASKRRREKEACSKEKENRDTGVVGIECSPDTDKAVISNNALCCKIEPSDSILCNDTDCCNCKTAESCAIPKGSKDGCVKCQELQKAQGCGNNDCDKNREENFGARISLFSAIEGSESVCPLKYHNHTKSISSAVSVRTLDSDISVLVDGENAMFPDQPLNEDSETMETEDKKYSEMSNDSSKRMVSSENGENDEEDDTDNLHEETCMKEMESYLKEIMSTGWTVEGETKLTVAELFLMLGQNGELKLEYEWVAVKSEAEIMQEKLLMNLNMLRRLSHLATVEFTDFTKAPGSGVCCQLCGQVQGGKQKTGGRGKEKSPTGKGKVGKQGRDMATQTQAPLVNRKEIPISPAPTTMTAGQDGVFRVPIVSPNFALQAKTAMPGKTFVQRMNPPLNKPLMRPRKLKPVSRGHSRPPTNLAQRTILPKNSQLVTFYPVVAGPHTAGQVGDEKNMVSQTIVGHPISGIQTQAVTMTTSVTNTVPAQAFNGTNGLLQTNLTPSSPGTGSVMEISLSPDDDHTLMRIPASQVGSMSQEVLQAAGLSAVPASNGVTRPLSIATTSGQGVTRPLSIATTTSPPTPGQVLQVSTHSSLSPPNLSSLLDMSLSGMGTSADASKFMDMVGEASFSSLLGDDTNKSLALDPVLTTPPIRVIMASTRPASPPLPSPPVRSLFRGSPMPEAQWLNGEAPDLSLTGFLELQPKPSSSRDVPQPSAVLPPNLFSDCSRDSQSNKIDVDSTLRCMMNENSIDYVKKFADLAEQIAAQGDGTTQQNKKTYHHSSVT